MINSGWELEQHLLTGRDTRAVPRKDSDSLTAQLIEVRKMLYGLLSHLKAKSGEKSKGSA